MLKYIDIIRGFGAKVKPQTGGAAYFALKSQNAGVEQRDWLGLIWRRGDTVRWR